MTTFYVWCPSLGQTRDDAESIDAEDVCDASEQYVESYEQRQCDYTVASGHITMTCHVSREDSDYHVKVDVEGVPRPRYLGRVMA